MPIAPEEIQDLFRRFCAPLAGYASLSSARKELTEMLARHLWAAMIAGPRMEEATWDVLQTEGRLSDEDLQPIQEVYYDEMKPVVSEEQLAALRERYNVRLKDV